MDVTAVAIVLSGLGGAYDVGGLVLVARGIRADRGAAKRLLTGQPESVRRPAGELTSMCIQATTCIGVNMRA